MLLDTAFEIAKRLDAGTEPSELPLFGVPISLKDPYGYIGYDQSMGMTAYCNQPAKENAPMVDALVTMGAIPIFKTNVPQTMLSFECGSYIFGRTENPVKNGYTCGGSSGGEACALALNAAAVGFGSDIGGSLRIPAHYSGIYGLKASRFRFSTRGSNACVRGVESIVSVTGPMARSAADLSFISRLLLQKSVVYKEMLLDPKIMPLPWRPELYDTTKKYKFGYFYDNEVAHTSPACQRAVKEAVIALKAAGHEVVPFNDFKISEASLIFAGLSGAEGYDQFKKALGKEPAEPPIQFLISTSNIPKWVLAILRKFVIWFKGDYMYAKFITALGRKSLSQVYDLTSQRDAIRHQWTRSFVESGVDGIICPTQAIPALPHFGSNKTSALSASTLCFNVVDFTATTLPVTTVKPELDAVTSEWRAEWPKISGTNSFGIINEIVYNGKKPLYDAQKMAGLPVGVQIVGKTWEEEKVLAMSEVLANALKAKTK